jgi:hypothetical protein
MKKLVILAIITGLFTTDLSAQGFDRMAAIESFIASERQSFAGGFVPFVGEVEQPRGREPERSQTITIQPNRMLLREQIISERVGPNPGKWDRAFTGAIVDAEMRARPSR